MSKADPDTRSRIFGHPQVLASASAAAASTTPPQVESVAALLKEAAALRAKARVVRADGRVIKQTATEEIHGVQALQEEADSQLADAAAISKAAKMKVLAAKEDLRNAAFVNQTAHKEVVAADALRKQADWQIASAKALLITAKGSHVASAIEDMARTQEGAAESARKSAATQAAKGETMAAKAANMADVAQEKMDVARTIEAMVSQEAKSAVRTKKQAVAWAGMISRIGADAKSMEAQAEKDLAQARRIEKAAAARSEGLVKAHLAKAEATKAIQEANETQRSALQDLATAKNLTASARRSMESAKAITKQVEVQIEAMGSMSKEAKDMRSKELIRKMANSQAKVADRVEGNIAGELKEARAMGRNATELDARARKALKTSEDRGASALEERRRAETTLQELDAGEVVESAAVNSVKLMLGAAKADLTAAYDLERMARRANQSAADISKSASSDVADEHAVAKKSDLQGSPAIVEMSKQGVEAASATREQADQASGEISEMEMRAKELRENGTTWMKKAEVLERIILETAEKSRVCVDLPGVRLKASASVNLSAVLAANEVSTASARGCSTKCLQHSRCRMSVFAARNGSCYLLDKLAPEVQEFEEGAFNSSLCGPKESKDELMHLLHKVLERKPSILPPVQCSWVGEDCSATKCCNNLDYSWDYTTITGYECYKSATSAGCHANPPPDWNGTVLGGSRTPREVSRAKKGIHTQGTSLFCFSAVMWHAGKTRAEYDTEAQIANNWKDHGVGIMQCDEHMILDGIEAPVSTWGSYSNIDAFIEIWENVRKDGRYLQHDWVVKVDPDAVFFPDRLRVHLGHLQTPQGAPMPKS